MNIKIKPGAAATIFITALFGFATQVYSQDSTPSPTSAREAVATSAKSAEKNAPQNAAASPDSSPESDFVTREELTGDWGGARSRLKAKGVELEFKLTQFVQGVTSGGIRHDDEYNGKFQTVAKFDLGKFAGWKYWYAEIRTETRFGGPLLGGTGTINPTNTAEMIPAAAGNIFAVTAVNFTRLIPLDLKQGNLLAISFGRYNLVDLADEDFFGGGGTERFFNIAPIGPLTVLRQVPLITNAATVAYIRHGEPFFTFAVMDTNDHSTTTGIPDLFKDGVTFSPGINFSKKYFGRSAKHSFGGAITTKAYTPFDAIRQVILPGPPLNPVQPKRGSWSVNYVFRQYIVERGKRDGWGFFSQVSFADKATSPITTFFNAGLGGNGLFKRRRGDEFGISYAYTDLSEVLKDNLNLIIQGGRLPRPEHQVEMFYNLHITPWLRLTADLQVIRPTRPIANTTVIPGARLEMIF
ncbi:MAG TPA: carbohydrate porin [Pyrinomonadaceae bacterium]|jgi:porin|nr:carbohydrate porin [Pyrinomonadaceae bacterium]